MLYTMIIQAYQPFDLSFEELWNELRRGQVEYRYDIAFTKCVPFQMNPLALRGLTFTSSHTDIYERIRSNIPW